MRRLMACMLVLYVLMQSIPTMAATGAYRISLEAESPDNILLGYGDQKAGISENGAASGGMVVNNLGGGIFRGGVLFPNVNVAKTGIYELTVSYVGGTERSFDINVNGEREYTVLCPVSDPDWVQPGSVKLDIYLHQGNNTIRVYRNRFDWWVDWDSAYLCPALDKLDLVYKNAGNVGVADQANQADGTATERIGIDRAGLYDVTVQVPVLQEPRTIHVSADGNSYSIPVAAGEGEGTVRIYLKEGSNPLTFDTPNILKTQAVFYQEVEGPNMFRVDFSNGGNIFTNNITEEGVYNRMDNDILWTCEIKGGPEGNTVELANVIAPATGRYRARICYSNQGSATFLINGKDAYSMQFSFREFGKPFYKDVYLTLNEGKNTFLVYSDDSAPLLNSITFSLLDRVTYDQAAGHYVRLGGQTPEVISYEAEDEANSMVGPDIRISEEVTPAGSHLVHYIGNKSTHEDDGNILTFPNVTVPEDGKYLLTSYYGTLENRYFDITVNGVDAYNIEFYPTQGWYSSDPRTILVDLKAGANSISYGVYGWWQWSPSLDRIEVRKFDESKFVQTEGVYDVLTCPAEMTGAYLDFGDTFDTALVVGQNANGGSSVSFPKVTVDADGLYQLSVRYAAIDPGSFDIWVNDTYAGKAMAYTTGNRRTYRTTQATVALKAGDNRITIGNSKDAMPYFYDMTITKADQLSDSQTQNNPVERIENDYLRIQVDKNTGMYDVYMKDMKIISGAQAKIRLGDRFVTSQDYLQRTISRTAYSDVLGKGEKAVVTHTADGLPSLIQTFYLYDELPYFLTEIALEDSAGISTNFMSPLSVNKQGGVDIGVTGDNRIVRYSYSNDTYNSVFGSMPLDSEGTGFEVTAVYDNDSRKGLVIGSVEHDVWKTGIFHSGSDHKLNILEVYGGVTSKTDTYDECEHGAVSGTHVKSPKIFVSYQADWREGLMDYGEVSGTLTPPAEWNQAVPIGWNSWGTYHTEMQYEDVINTSNYIADTLQPMGYTTEDGVTYVNLDAWYSRFYDKLPDFVEQCRQNGQKPGIYLSPYCYWGGNFEDPVLGANTGAPIGEWTWGDIVLKNPDGSYHQRASGGYFPLDPTHPGTQAYVREMLEPLMDMGFEFIKLDFMTGASCEGKFYDPAVTTGTQAMNVACEYLYQIIDNRAFIFFAISPYFPTQYAHAQLITSDIHHGDMYLSRIILSDLTYGGFWRAENVVKYTDSDTFVFEDENENVITDMNVNRTRLNSVIISGSTLLPGFTYDKPASSALVEQLFANTDAMAIAKMGKAFFPVEATGTFDQPSPIYVLEEDGKLYVAVFNLTGVDAEITVDFERAGIDPQQTYTARNIWTGTTETVKGQFTSKLAKDDSTIYILEKK